MEEISTLEDWRIAGADIDELETAIIKLSRYPVATQALLAALEERRNTREVALQKIINKDTDVPFLSFLTDRRQRR